MVQLTLQEARGLARIGNRRDADKALTREADILAKLPLPTNPDHHFVFDHAKWVFYAATAYTWLEVNDRAEEHALETIQMHTRPDGSSNAPMRVADAHIDLGIIHARRGDLDAAVEQGMTAFDIDRKSLSDLVHRAGDLDRVLRQRYRRETLAQEFHERYVTARRALTSRSYWTDTDLPGHDKSRSVDTAELFLWVSRRRRSAPPHGPRTPARCACGLRAVLARDARAAMHCCQAHPEPHADSTRSAAAASVRSSPSPRRTLP
ncbi:hypothetical protein [Streptosporangium saharense]|uniref:hypothetical protein n=1 Tax=Streptosporangium saharense TaxID=1706840 RepID=UPI0036BD4506